MQINSGDTAWLLIATAMVMLMTPGLAFFYGGMVRQKNLLSTLMMSFVMLGLISILWAFYGYSVSFGPDFKGLFGGLQWAGLMNVGMEPSSTYATTIPHFLFMMFQATFAIITVALITGGVVERIRFSALLFFSIIWFTVVYCPIAHWVWGSGGWLANLGVLDFAGGTVVHINAGFAALAIAMVLGPRRGFEEREVMEPNSIPYVVLGTALLWFGWFGFNAGSALARQRTGRQRLRLHQLCRSFRSHNVAHTRMDTPQAIGTGRRYRSSRGTGYRDAGFRIYPPHGRHTYRHRGGHHFLLCHALAQ